MATTEEVKKLAALARIKVEDAELEKFTSEFDAILAYIGQLETLDISQGTGEEKPPLRNVMRADGLPHAPGAYTEKLAQQFPARSSFAPPPPEATKGHSKATEDREGVYLEVKQIISHE